MIVRLGAAAVLLCSLVAVAGEPSGEQQAKSRFAHAQKLFDASQYEAALDEYKRAYELSHYPSILYRVAVCQDLLGRREEAIATYQAFLVVDPTSERRAAAEARLRELLPPTAPPVTEKPPATAEPSAPASAATTMPPTATPSPATSAATLTAPQPAPPRRLRRAAWAMTGVTAALAIAAIGVGGYTVAQNGHLQSSCGNRAAGCSDNQIASVTAPARATDVLIAGAAAAAVTTAVLFILDARRGRSAHASRAWLAF